MAAACRHYLNSRASTSKEVTVETEKESVKRSSENHPEEEVTSSPSLEDFSLDNPDGFNTYSFSSSHSVHSVVQIHMPPEDQSDPPLTLGTSVMPSVAPASRPHPNTEIRHERPNPYLTIDRTLPFPWYRNNLMPGGSFMLPNRKIGAPGGVLGTKEPQKTETIAGSVASPENELNHLKSNSSKTVKPQGEEYPASYEECLAKIQEAIADENNVRLFTTYFSAFLSKELGDQVQKGKEKGSKDGTDKNMPSTTLMEDTTMGNADDNIIYENTSFSSSNSMDNVLQVRTPDVDTSKPLITRAHSAAPLIVCNSDSPAETNLPVMCQRPLPASANDLSLNPPYYSTQVDNGSLMATGTSRLIFHRENNIANPENLVESVPEGGLDTSKPEETVKDTCICYNHLNQLCQCITEELNQPVLWVWIISRIDKKEASLILVHFCKPTTQK
ncbi:hypothetical protein J6590_069119 [Homalodisca vitripennis]|nr:hypothetical protein J6590_069119 [Homalodisca vitripennis]